MIRYNGAMPARPPIKRGEENGNHSLTERQVQQIREFHKIGMSLRAIGRAFNVNKSTVRKIAARRTWTHI